MSSSVCSQVVDTGGDSNIPLVKNRRPLHGGGVEHLAVATMADLGVDRVAFFPWMQHFKPSYRVVVTIQRLDGSLAGEAVLIARWAVTDAAGKQQLAAGKSDYRQPLEQSTFAALIKAESQLVAALSLEIAEGVMALRARYHPVQAS